MDHLSISEWSERDVQQLLQAMDLEKIEIELYRAESGSFRLLPKINEERRSGEIKTKQSHGYHADRCRFLSRTEFQHYAVVKLKAAEDASVALEMSLNTEFVYKFPDPAVGDEMMGRREVYAKVRGVLDSWPFFRSYIGLCASQMGFNASPLNPQTTLGAIRMAGFGNAGKKEADK